jgi:uncharacterized membrane protein (DUF2068 family)
MKQQQGARVHVEVETASGIVELEFRAGNHLSALMIAKDRLREAHSRVFHQWHRQVMEESGRQLVS